MSHFGSQFLFQPWLRRLNTWHGNSNIIICLNFSHFVTSCMQQITSVIQHANSHGPSKLNWHFRHIDDLWRAWEHGFCQQRILQKWHSQPHRPLEGNRSLQELQRATDHSPPHFARKHTFLHWLAKAKFSSKLGYITCRTWQEVFDCKYVSISSRVLPPDSKDASNVAPAINIATSTKGNPANKKKSPHFTSKKWKISGAFEYCNARQPKKSQAP